MLKEQRKRKILNLIETNSQVQIAELVALFDVSDMTIRRDLQDLAQKGLIKRTHGGAVSVQHEKKNVEPPIIERSNDQKFEKRQIARKVAGLIRDGEKIFLGSGTTTLAIAEELKDHRNLTVITNAVTIINTLIPATQITIIGLGGFLRRSEMSMIGHFTEAALANLQVDKVIIGIRGIDLDYGLTSDDLQELITDQAILKIGKEVIVAADHTKFGYVAAIRTAPITMADMIVTDDKVPDEIVDAIRISGTQVIKA
jgi:DeoR/GlpR family transcriptional regulator of sugar metabolism